MTTTLGVSAVGVRPVAGTLARAKPTVVVTSPSGVQTTVSLSFTYSSPVGRAQRSYQYQVRSSDGSFVLSDSGTVVSTDTGPIAVDFAFSGGSSYQLWVRASDLFDTSEWAVVNFSIDLFDVNDYPTEPRVGSVYEIGINGQGYMLSDNPERMVQRRSTVLDAPRFVTGDTPFTEAIERYTFAGGADFTGGAGQEYLDREDSVPTRYRASQGVNPFLEDTIQLLPSTSIEVFDNFATPYLVVAGGRSYLVTANGELTSKATPAGGSTVFTITGAGAPTSMCSDGTNWYYADGSNVYRNSSAADPGSAWSTIDAQLVRWAADRIAATYVDGSSNICVTTLSPVGAEEVPGGRFKYPSSGHSIPDMVGGDGFLWFILNRSESSQIHYWQLGTSDTYAAVGLTLPAGQRATQLGFYLGNVFVRAIEPLATGTRVIIYRCVPSDGVLTPQRVLDWESTADESVGSFAGDDRFVFFTWRNMTSFSTSGLGAIDLSTGGWAKWIAGGTAQVRSVANWNGRLTYSLDGTGQMTESTTPVSTGWLETSFADQGSSLTKIYDQALLSFDPLPAGGEVSIEYSTNGGVSYTALGSPADTAGQSSLAEDIGVEGRSIGLRVTLSTSTSSPKLRTIQVKLHARSLSDQLVTFPVNCSDQITGLNGQPLPDSGPGTGLLRIRRLEDMMGSRVKLQDVDWPLTGVTSIWELVDVQSATVGVFDPLQGRRVDSGTATITLRRGQ